jgi:hypothetical protein
MSADELSTVEYITEKLGVSAALSVSPTHHISGEGEFTGFQLEMDSLASVGNAPFNPSMFCGLACCLVQTSDKVIAQIMLHRESFQQKLQDLVKDLEQEVLDGAPVASFDCIPVDYHGACKDNIESTQIRANRRKGVDNVAWVLEPPKMVGVSLGYIRLSSGERSQRLFVVCDSGCPNACMQYYNMMLDLGGDATLGEAAHCEETWWLQRACSRARNRLLYVVCEKLGLTPEQSITDIHSFNNCKIAVPVCETMRCDFYERKDKKVVLLNSCVDTTRVQNGILCKMHESEGFWIFHGAPRSHSRNVFGGPFGKQTTFCIFPMETYECSANKNVPHVTVYVNGLKKNYFSFNNNFLQHLTLTGWERDYGVTELLPLVCCHNDPLPR